MFNLFTKQTLAGIMSSFTETLTKLEAFADNRTKDSGILFDEIAKLSADRELAQAEAEQARTYAANIRSMLEGK